MTCYTLRKNFITTEAKLAFKTKETHWLDTRDPVIILVSIYSAFHANFEGSLKMNALVTTIKNNVKGPVTVLLADRAHIRARGEPFAKCLHDAQALNSRFVALFEGCNVAYWHSYICQDESFAEAHKAVKDLCADDPVFRGCLLADGKGDCAAMEDIMEQCACILVLSKKGYRFQFYPGRPYASAEYIQQSEKNRVAWVNVFLAIERKYK